MNETLASTDRSRNQQLFRWCLNRLHHIVHMLILLQLEDTILLDGAICNISAAKRHKEPAPSYD